MALVVQLSAAPLWAGAFDVSDDGWEGYSELLALTRSELGADRVEVRGVLDWQQLRANDGVLVIHPMQDINPDEATAFMRAGGRIAIADDFGHGDRLLARFQIIRRMLPSDPASFLRGKVAFAIAQPVQASGDSRVSIVHPTVATVHQVALNHGTGFRHPDLTPVIEVQAQNGEAVAVAIAGQVENGRLFALGDPSVFINQMLRFPGNRELARGLVRYLADGDSTAPRGGRLFIVANRFHEKGAYGTERSLRKEFEQHLHSLHQKLLSWRDRGFPWWLNLVLAVLLVAGVCLWSWRAMVQLQRARTPRFAQEELAVAQGGVAGRIAVLSSPASSAVLTLIELRMMFTELLSDRLRAPPEKSSLAAMVAMLKSRVELSADLDQTLTNTVKLLQLAETSVVSGQALAVSTAETVEVARVIDQVLEVVGAAVRLPARAIRPVGEDDSV